jgi:phage terminase small subunit
MGEAYKKLTDKQRRFVDHYVVHLRVGEAARAAGYGPGRPDVAGSKLMARERVRAAIEECMRRQREETALSEAWVLDRLRIVVDRCLQAEPARDRRGEPTGQYQFDAAGANRALELIGRHFAMFTDNVNLRDLDGLTDEELDQRIAEQQREAGIPAVTH